MRYGPIRAWFCHAAWFPFCMARYRENNQKRFNFWLLYGRNQKFNCVCLIIFLSLSCNLGLWYELKNLLGHFVVFSKTAPCRKETNMAVASMMICKIGLIWRHMKTLYSQFAEHRLSIQSKYPMTTASACCMNRYLPLSSLTHLFKGTSSLCVRF